MIYEMDGCGGCGTCEMVCSFHHSNAFNPSISSIRIIEKEEGDGYRVELVENDRGRIVACDGCGGLETPLCCLYCSEKDTLAMILSKFLGREVSPDASDGLKDKGEG